MEFEKPKQTYSQGKFDINKPVISQSFLNMFADCALAAYYRYVEGRMDPPGVAALQGSSVDAAVTAGCESVIKTGKDASLKDKRDVAASVFESKWDETKTFAEDDRGALKDQAIKLVDAHHVIIAPKLKPVSVQEVIVSEEDGFSLAGTIDLVEEGDIVADTKTSRTKYALDAVLTNVQPSVYTRLYAKKYGKPPSSFRYDVLVKTKEPTIQRVSGTVGETQLELLDYRIKSSIAEFKSSVETGLFRLAAPGHWRCSSTGKWCGFLKGCPKGGSGYFVTKEGKYEVRGNS